MNECPTCGAEGFEPCLTALGRVRTRMHATRVRLILSDDDRNRTVAEHTPTSESKD